MNIPPTVVVIASTMIDMISYVQRAPTAGETVRGNDFSMGFGGKGANQAVMAKRAGASVYMCACLGDDVFGRMSLDHYAAEGLDLGGVRLIPGVSSGVAPIWVEASGENRIIVSTGANDHLIANQADMAVRRPETVHVVLSQMEVPQTATRAAFEAAHHRGAITVFNPAPAQEPIAGLLDLCDWVIVNETEFNDLLTETPSVDEPTREAMLNAGSRLRGGLVVTLGDRGAAMIHRGRLEMIGTQRVGVVDTTGAGDAFVGAFAALVGAGEKPLNAIQGAVQCASHSVTVRGTQSSYPTIAETAALLAAPTHACATPRT